jgi:hypothetical protein
MKVISTDFTKVIEYFGAKFTIPSSHTYIATDWDGAIYSYYHQPDFDGTDWTTSGGFCRIGTAELHSSEAETSLQSCAQ